MTGNHVGVAQDAADQCSTLTLRGCQAIPSEAEHQRQMQGLDQMRGNSGSVGSRWRAVSRLAGIEINAILAGAAIFLHPAFASAQTGTPVLTRSYNNNRTGANTTESILTPEKVGTLGLTRMRLPLPGEGEIDDPRIEAQPLYVPGLVMKDGKPHDVIFACSMGNSIYAFDANTGHLLPPYPISLGPSVPASNTTVMADIAYWGVNDHWGILSTPVIDIDSETMYVVNWMLESDGQRVFRMNAVDLVTGQPRLPSQAIRADFGEGPSYTAFDPNMQKQRAALLLVPLRQTGEIPVKKVLYMACGETQEGAAGHHGWLIAFDPETLKSTASWCTTPYGSGGGIWMSGQGPSADSQGDVYVITANGDFNGYVTKWAFFKYLVEKIAGFGFVYKPLSYPIANYSECFVKLHYSPPAPDGGPANLEPIGWWCPFRDKDRRIVEDYAFMDQDLGSAGAVLPLGTDLLLGGGKDGILYVFDRNNLGNAFQDYSVLKQNPPAFITYDPPPGKSSTGNLDFFAKDDKTHHIHGTPVVWRSPDQGTLLYVWGENEYLRAWTLDPATGKVSLFAKGAEITTANGLHGGMPGGMLTLSANADNADTGIVWGTTPIYADASKYVCPGILRAYDASEPDPKPNGDGSKRLQLLWDSVSGNSHNGSNGNPAFPFSYDKFCPPVVADGKVIVATYDGHIDVYELNSGALPPHP